MKAAFVVAALAAAVSAQIGGLPSCATSCAIGGISATGCQLTDIACVCRATSFLQSVSACIQKPVASGGCSPDDQAATYKAAAALCAQAGVTITTPGAAPATTSAAAPPTTSQEATTTAAETSAASEPTTMAAMPSSSYSNSTSTNGTTPEPYTGGAALVSGSWAVAGLGALLAVAL